jgi:hypothetical protein
MKYSIMKNLNAPFWLLDVSAQEHSGMHRKTPKNHQ